MAKNPNKIKEPVFDRVFYAVCFVILLFLLAMAVVGRIKEPQVEEATS